MTTNSTDLQHSCQWHITTGGVMLNAFPDSIFDRPQNGKSEMISKRAVETVDTFRHTIDPIEQWISFFLAKSLHH